MSIDPAINSLESHPYSEVDSTNFQFRPRLKSGRNYWRAGPDKTLRIGTRFESHLLPNSIDGIELAGLLSLCDGRRSIIEIAKAIKFQPGLIEKMLLSIARLGVLELNSNYFDSNPDSKLVRGASSLSTKNFQERFNIEAAGTACDMGIAGNQLVQAREHFQIEIFGSGRIATLLFANLLTIGFSDTSITNRRHPNHPSQRVRPRDICGAQFVEGEIGQFKSRIFEDIGERARLFPKEDGERKNSRKPDLAIIVGPPAPDLQQELLSSGIPHLLVDFAASDEVRIGPLVSNKPGKESAQPCINCISLAGGELGAPPIEALDNDLEVGAALAVVSAGLVALEVMRISASNQSQLTGRTLLITSRRFFEPLLTNWQQHPACGCNWL